MEIKDFIVTTLVDIQAALDEAEKTTKKDYELMIHTNKKGIEFDLAVTSSGSTDSGTSKSGGVKVWVMSAEGESKKARSEASQSTSRIRFTVFPH